jgi:collagen type I/II/III/V/XI/XXIV/XXVII alpha
MSFNPPSGVTNGAEYAYGNIVWKFDASSGVWNIVDGSVVGGQGPKGDQGDPGVQGNTGNTGPTGAGAATGDSGAFIVRDGVGTVRVTSTAGATGVASFDPRFFSFGASGHIRIGGSLGGIQVVDEGKVGAVYGWGDTLEIEGATGIAVKQQNQIGGTKFPFQIFGLTATHAKPGVASFDATYFTISSTGNVDLASAYAATGDTVITVAGSGIGIATEGRTDTLYNIGVTSFNGLTGIVSLTGDTGAIFGYENSRIGARFGSYTLTGVASFDPRYFGIGLSGHLTLTGSYQVTGDTVQAGYGINIGAGKVINNTGVTSFNGATGTISITGSQYGVPYIDTSFRAQGGLTASSTFIFNGTSLTFGSTTSRFTVTGPSIVLGAATEITGGVFKNPAEGAPHFTLNSGTNDIVVNGISGSIQRFTITPNAKVTIKTGTGWHALTTATETIALIIQNKSGYTGSFDSNILVDGSGSPILFGPDTTTNYGVTGGVSVITLMRVNKGSGAGLTMGFVISTGMTASNVTIN